MYAFSLVDFLSVIRPLSSWSCDHICIVCTLCSIYFLMRSFSYSDFNISHWHCCRREGFGGSVSGTAPFGGSCTSYNITKWTPVCHKGWRSGYADVCCRWMSMNRELPITLFLHKFTIGQGTIDLCCFSSYVVHYKKESWRSWKNLGDSQIISKVWSEAHLLLENYPEVLRLHSSYNRSNLNERKNENKKFKNIIFSKKS